MKRPVSIQSIAVEKPKRSVANTESPFSDIKEISQRWWDFWGVSSRFQCSESWGENELSLAKKACEAALKKAGKTIENIDLLLCNSSTPFLETPGSSEKRMFPRLSAELKKALGGKSALNWDVEVECASFLFQLQVAAGFIKQGRYDNILICSSEYISSVLDYTSRSSTVFGDGAVAAVLTADELGGNLLASSSISKSDLYDLATIRWGYPSKNQSGQAFSPSDFRIYFHLQDNGKEQIADFIPQTLPTIVERAIQKANVDMNDISFFAFHQPSKFIVDLWAHRLGGIQGRYDKAIETNGCMVSCSMPNTFFESLASRKPKPNDLVVLAGPGTGWGFFAQVWKLGNIAY